MVRYWCAPIGTCRTRAWRTECPCHELARAANLRRRRPTLRNDTRAVHPERELAGVLTPRDAFLLDRPARVGGGSRLQALASRACPRQRRIGYRCRIGG